MANGKLVCERFAQERSKGADSPDCLFRGGRVVLAASCNARCRVAAGSEIVQVFEPEFTSLQLKVLDPLHVPATVHDSTITS